MSFPLPLQTRPHQPTTQKEKPKKTTRWAPLIIAAAVLVIVLLLPTPAGLSVAGQRSLAILGFAVILWITEAVSYPVSAALILGLSALLLGLSPNDAKPGTMLGTSTALSWALAGFSNSATALVAGAMFLSAAMQKTMLDKRIALNVLTRVGSSTKGILWGAILVGIILAFFVPSTTARVGAVLPIMMGMVSAFGLEKNSKLAGLLMMTSAQIASVWNVGLKTASAQNVISVGFMEKAFNIHVSWGQWFVYAVPWAVIMSVVVYFVMLKVMPPEMDSIPNGNEMVKKQLEEMGPLSSGEKRLLIISLLLLFFWGTEKIVHPFDSTTTTLIAVAIMLTPGIGVFSWKDVESKIPWGTLILFAVGISLGVILLNTKAATWLSNFIFHSIGFETTPILVIVAILTAFNILIHIGFASASSVASTLIPVFIALVQGLARPDLNGPGMIMIQAFAISFGFLLPVNAPQNALAYATESFTTKDFLKSGVPFTIIGYLLILLMSATYWKWIGLL